LKGFATNQLKTPITAMTMPGMKNSRPSMVIMPLVSFDGCIYIMEPPTSIRPPPVISKANNPKSCIFMSPSRPLPAADTTDFSDTYANFVEIAQKPLR